MRHSTESDAAPTADPIPMAYATPSAGDPRRVGRLRWTLWLLVAGWAACLVGILSLVTIDAETAVVSGPALVLIGIVTIVYASRAGLPLARAIGIAHVVIVTFLTLMVSVNNWSPGRAQDPLFVFGGFYLLLITLPTLAAALSLRAQLRDIEAYDFGWMLEGRPVAVSGMLLGGMIMMMGFFSGVVGVGIASGLMSAAGRSSRVA
ncbi:MAG TPA: hypothetical protein VGN72_15670 [Tepidisphaeraceae bacterium]|nr:hypothetical protein [Tepidisphaeraceae bacterium]